MAQMALSFHINGAVGVTEGMTEKQVEQIVKKLLKGLKKLPAEIRAAERKVTGIIGHAPGKGRILSSYEKFLAKIGSEHMKDRQVGQFVHKEKAENLFAAAAAATTFDHHREALEELAGMMMGNQLWSDDGVEFGGRVVTHERYAELYTEHIWPLEKKALEIQAALNDLLTYNPRASFILYRQYVEGEKVDKVIRLLEQEERKKLPADEANEFTIAEATYHRWRKEAVEEFGRLVGLC